MCRLVHKPKTLSVPLKPGFKHLCAAQGGCWESDSGPLGEEYMALPAEPALQPYLRSFEERQKKIALGLFLYLKLQNS